MKHSSNKSQQIRKSLSRRAHVTARPANNVAKNRSSSPAAAHSRPATKWLSLQSAVEVNLMAEMCRCLPLSMQIIRVLTDKWWHSLRYHHLLNLHYSPPNNNKFLRKNLQTHHLLEPSDIFCLDMTAYCRIRF